MNFQRRYAHFSAIGTAVLGLCAATGNANAQTIGTTQQEARESQSSPSVRDIFREEHTLFTDRITIEPSISYSYSDRDSLALRGFLALDAIFLGELNLDNVESHITTVEVNTRYGITDRLEASLNIPFVYRTTELESIGGDLSTEQNTQANVSESGLGDVTATLAYRLLPETVERPDVVVSLGVRAPTGKDPYGIDIKPDPNNTNLNVPEELPTGNGVWGVTAGVSVLKTLDPAIVFANLGYTYNIEKDFDDISGGSGNQKAEVDLGDSITAGFGTAFALNERLSLALSYNHEYVRDTYITPDSGSRTKVVGSDANIGVFNIGGSYAMSDTTSIVTNLGIGLTEDASDIKLTFRMPFQL
ncbi:transporter [Halomonas binhaiensis]|uniref:Transporter n=1 Tax=Halomonas binhaiensis TaxID=2562282 RepID=A0A5C1NEY6_9GAMM|nr:transporter [Halomonas binhaiensis]QEM80825.1 transporter [Halomonas binhaiensis]